MAVTNRRSTPRRIEEAAIQVLQAIGGTGRNRERIDLIPGRMLNNSRDGMYIETDRALEPGSNVSIKMVSPEGRQQDTAYYRRDGQVIWCRQFDNRIARFGIGIKILRKVVQADVLTSRFR